VSRRERMVRLCGIGLLAALGLGWTWSIAHATALSRSGVVAPSPTHTVTAALTGDAPTTAYLTDAAVSALADTARGTSGKLRVATALPSAASRLVEALKPVADLSLITLVPFSEKKQGHIGLYFLGSWPAEHGAKGPPRAPSDRYAAPTGFIEVTRDNQDTPVSEHFRLRDFVTHDQPNVWPKYIALQLRNVDKLELVLADLESRGISTAGVVVMSGFRTPQYNEGGGNTGGRAGNSRHMYGDAADIYLDNDHNGVMDDLNHDGHVDIGDSKVIQASVDRVEAAHPELVGGAGVYVASAGHGPFIHIDSRGYRARWIGSGGG
jgi:hypothetical protein